MAMSAMPVTPISPGRFGAFKLSYLRLQRRSLGSLFLTFETYLKRLCVVPPEAHKPLPLLCQGFAGASGQRLKWLDHERRLRTSSLRLPRPPDEAVDEHRGWNHAVLGGDHLAVVVGDDAGAIGMREDQVVELGQEAWRRRGIWAGTRCVGQVVQPLALLVAEGTQAWPEPIDHLAEPGQARPDLDVLDGGRAERPEVAYDHLV